jgi:isopentenyldiphosphate isomerase
MIELQDVYTEMGEPTGAQKTKQQIFEAGDWRKVVHVWLIDSLGQIMVQKRADNQGKGIFDGLWDVTVGGGLTAGEEPVVAARRELDEELGILLPEGAFQHIGQFPQPKIIPESNLRMNDHSETFCVFRDVELDQLTLQPSEVADAKKMPLGIFLHEVTDPRTAELWVPHGQDYFTEVERRIKQLMV